FLTATTPTENSTLSLHDALPIFDPNTCNVRDTARFTIEVYEATTANFSFSPILPVENTPTTFVNNSSMNSTLFKWLFGDGDSLIDRKSTRLNSSHVKISYAVFCL